MANPSEVGGKTANDPKGRGKRDLIEGDIEVALNPGAFILGRACSSFVTDLRRVATKVEKVSGTEPARAVGLFETFLAGCYEKANELDDSSGTFGAIVGGLFCKWIKSRQAADATPDDTASRLLAWMDDDPLGILPQSREECRQGLEQGRPHRVRDADQGTLQYCSHGKAGS